MPPDEDVPTTTDEQDPSPRPPSRWRFVVTLLVAAVVFAVVVWLVDLAFDS
ncbi:hypothetical protein [Georgenia sp. Z1491]|uniref:hypothetical protein n=1 Tax=Georgenia sp. Z1491 TaxID=3416707 RepID=UPI003CF34FF8